MVDETAARCQPTQDICRFEVSYGVTPAIRTVTPAEFQGDQVDEMTVLTLS